MKLLCILIIAFQILKIKIIICSSNNDFIKGTFISKSVLLNYLEVSANDSMRIDHLNQFLSAKIYQLSEKINLMLIPELR